MGGKQSKGNDAVVQEQQRQAAEARQKEADRQARISQGLGSIKQAFEGAPIMGTRSQAFDWNGLTAPTGTEAQRAAAASGAVSPFGASTANLAGSALPQGYSWVQTAAPTQPGAPVRGNSAARSPFGNTPEARPGLTPDPSHPGYSRAANAQVYTGGDSGRDAGGLVWTGTSGARGGAGSAVPGGGQVWAIRGPDGQIHYQGQGFNYDASYDTGGRTGGFDDSFYDKFKQGILDYYMPQVQDQYGDAKNELTYRLARAGTLNSSAAATEVADLSKQNDLNRANILNQADKGAADLRSQVATERAKAESQLYATEDPTTSANQALAAVRNISLEQPALSPLGKIFDLASVGGANFLQGYRNQTNANKVGALPNASYYVS